MKKRPLPKRIRKELCSERLQELRAHEQQVKALRVDGEESSLIYRTLHDSFPRQSIAQHRFKIQDIDYSALESRMISHLMATGDGHHRLRVLQHLRGLK